jgi:aminoglycoside phosphotransferase (APT) family kinase protein
LTQEFKPEGEAHWSCRSMAKAAGVSPATVQRVRSARGLKSHLLRTFKLSNDRRFDEKLIDVVGVYLNPPDKAVVLCMDEKSQIQALDRTQPSLPLKKGRAGTMTHDYKRDGDWRDGGFRQRRPSVETLAWVAASMGRGSRIVGYRRLTGGVCSAVNRLTVERRGMRTFVVLRQYPGGLGLQGSLEKEIANLGVVAGSGLPVPSILATDVAGASTGGAPSLLMTRLQGHVHLNPAEPRSWMTRIAEIAVLLHSLDLPAKMFRPWTDSWIAPLDGFQVPVDAQKPAVWKAAFGVMAAPPPKDTAVFLHCDLLPVNMLWSRGRITGLTDWNSIHRGARAIDVGHCRRYLAALYSPEWSEQLRSLYESIAGVTLDPWWDLYALLHYDDSGPKWIRGQVAGRRPVDVPGMTSRVEVAIETALRRLG